MDAEQIGNALDLKRSGGSWRGCCPCCGGSARSGKFILSEKNGKLLWFCHAGCHQDAIRAELVDRGLLAKPNERRPQPKYTRDQVEHAALTVLVAEAAIRKSDPIITRADNRRDLMRAVLVIREAKHASPAITKARQALASPAIKEYISGGRKDG